MSAAPVAAVSVVNEQGRSPLVLICEHASNHIPARYGGLGLTAADLQQHIAWDIGAAELARGLSRRLDAPLLLSGYSRLLIDCNRPLGVPSSIPARSGGVAIPGNADVDPAEAARRAASFFTPFQRRIERCLNEREALGLRTLVVGVHSFTPVLKGVRRPWQVGVLYGRAAALGRRLVSVLAAEPGLCVGDNEPYRIELEEDYTVPVHGDARGNPAVLIEVRQDLLVAPGGIDAWADRLAAALGGIAADGWTA